MSKPSASSPFRALLTDTLPYEVPVIFSNDKWFALANGSTDDADVKRAISKIVVPSTSYTIPYSYDILKTGGTTRLSIIHPQTQLNIAKFYETHGRTIIACCSKSEYSLRSPIGVADAFFDDTPGETYSAKTGHVEKTRPADSDFDTALNPTYVSFFAYGKYNLLGKFMESQEFIRLEKKFKLMRSLDVTKCFYNIYTHSVTWAVKSKEFAKDNSNSYSFESQFDWIMQKSNYNETNGIVVGPEASRLFAEIIFQDADRKVYNRLMAKEFYADRDYGIRRYVDDYFVFANSLEDLSAIEDIIRTELACYKLYLNEKKITTSCRPFVSEISLARREMGNILFTLKADIYDAPKITDARLLASKAREIKRQIKELRLLVARFGVSFSTLSGWLLSALRSLLHAAGTLVRKATSNLVNSSVDIISSLIELVFYVVALDARVRPIYNLCQILSSVMHDDFASLPDRGDRIAHLINEELVLIITSLVSPWRGVSQESLELYNLLICGAQYLGSDFVCQASISRILKALSEGPTISYFRYLALKFCYLKNKNFFQADIDALNSNVILRLAAQRDRLNIDSEMFMLACDFLSSPDVSNKQRSEVFQMLAKGQISNAALKTICSSLGFADWGGLRVDHLLQRRQLRPVYSWV